MLAFGFYKVRQRQKKLKSELLNTEREINKMLAIIRGDIEDSIRLLEHTKSKRALTGVEEAIIERFRINILDIERSTRNEVKKIEK